MFFSKNYIQFSKDLDINNYKHNIYIMTTFIKKYIEKMENKGDNNKKLYEDALIYSKYYLHYKTINCIYNNDIMNILLYIEK
jgi:hypothetical protein